MEYKLQAIELTKQSKETLRNGTRGRYLGQSKTKDSFISKPKNKKEEENISIKKELYEIKLERDTLKKALDIFAKSDR